MRLKKLLQLILLVKLLKKNNLNYLNAILKLLILGSLSFSQVKYELDTNKSTLHWYGYKVTGQHDGNVNINNGYVILNSSSSIISDAYIEIDMNSISVSDIKSEKWNKKLVNHLKDDDFFSVSDYPVSSLKVLSQVHPDNLVVYDRKDKYSEILYNCLITIKGIENIIRVPITISKSNEILFASGTIKLDRTLWDIKYKSQKYFASLEDRVIYDDFMIDFSLYVNE